MPGLFITFEGIEGCGKSTQAARLADALEAGGRKVLRTRQPGGSAIGQKIREILLDRANTALTPLAELLLYEADRAQHVSEVIRPALDRGEVVISDRYADATAAYQGAARGLDPRTVAELNRIATGGLVPERTFVLDLAPDVALGRAKARGAPDRLEAEGLAFHQRVRDGYLAIAKAEPARVRIVDASGTVESIAQGILEEVLQACRMSFP
jgi:dTMP kinase